jgi:hypothetical protein
MYKLGLFCVRISFDSNLLESADYEGKTGNLLGNLICLIALLDKCDLYKIGREFVICELFA